MLKLMSFTNLIFCFLLVHVFFFFKITDLGFVLTHWFSYKVSSVLNSESNGI